MCESQHFRSTTFSILMSVSLWLILHVRSYSPRMSRYIIGIRVLARKAHSGGQEQWKDLSSYMYLIGKLLIKITAMSLHTDFLSQFPGIFTPVYFSILAVHFCHLVYSNREEENNFKDQSWRPIPRETSYLVWVWPGCWYFLNLSESPNAQPVWETSDTCLYIFDH